MQADIIAALAAALAEQMGGGSRALGFGDAPDGQDITFVFVNNVKAPPYQWYTLEGTKPNVKQVPIEAPSMYGRLTGIQIENTTRRDKDSAKLRLTVQADKKYVFEMGATTTAGKGMLAALHVMLEDGSIDQPFYFQFEDGTTTENKVQLARVTRGDKTQVVTAKWSEIDFNAVTRALLAHFKPADADAS